MKLKKVILGATAVALTAAVSIGATLAYLTDTDEDVNVMTLGNVYIDQIEQERVDDKEGQTTLVDFEQNKPLLPAVYPDSSIPWAPESEWVVPSDPAWKVVQDNTNVIDKFVTVKNTGKSDAYVRTIFAFEEDSSLIHVVTNSTNITDGATWEWDWNVGTIELDGVTYSLAVATYTEAVKPGDTTIPSLKQVYMDKTATNEYCAKYGETYDILVFSQAIQTKGFKDPAEALNEGFGAINKDNNYPWKDRHIATEAEKAKDALAVGGDITIANDMNITSSAEGAKNVVKKDATVNFGDNVINLDLPNATPETDNWIGVEILGTPDEGDSTKFTPIEVVFNGEDGGITTAPNSELFCAYVRNGSTLTINGGTYIGGGSCVQVREGTLIVNGGYFAVVNNDFGEGIPDNRYVLNCTDSNYRNDTANIIVKGGSFLNWNPADNAAEGAGTNFVADGYTVVETTVEGGTLYTVVPA